MGKAKFYIHADEINHVILALRGSGASIDAIVSLIHPGFADETYVPPEGVDDSAFGELVSHFGQENPFKWFDYRGDEYRVSDGDGSPPGFVLPFRDDPMTLWQDDTNPPENVDIQRVVDVEIGFADHGAPAQVHRAPGEHGVSFLRRGNAAHLLDCKAKTRNRMVHVFVVDQGMDSDYIDAIGGADTYQGILWNTDLSNKPTPGVLPTEHADRYRSRPQWHAHMIVRNVLAMARDNRGATDEIKIYDVPVIPDRVADVLSTAETIHFVYQAILAKLSSNDRAVIVNAWGVKNRFRETPIGRFTEDETHLLNKTILRLAVKKLPSETGQKLKRNKKTAVVFAAGNNGLFTPNPEAGPLDRGPMRSIWYPAALPFVWSTAATDLTGKWIGVSSQGPAGANYPDRDPPDEKPDLALPSYFSEDVDSHALNTGTSASCGLLAGMLAGHWRNMSKINPPNQATAGQNAKKFGHVGHSGRLGNGVPQDDKF